MLQRRYRPSPRARLHVREGAAWLACEHPLQALRLNDSAWAVLSRLDGEAWLHELADPVTPALTDYLDGLAERGLLRVEFRSEPPASWPHVHVVVPAYGAPEALARCLESLRALDYPAGRFDVTVVDDGSPEPLQPALAAAGGSHGAVRWVRRDGNGGPADARNAGVAALEAAHPHGAEAGEGLIAFLDSDCVAERGWLREAAALLETPHLAAVGGAVAGLRRDTWLARYEDACSSLHMGERPGRAAAPGAPIPYLPTCNLVLRGGAFRAVGGFRAGWRTGEDVDLSWRLAAAGERLFYWPALRVRHDHRVTLTAFLARRRDYARSEGPLARDHPRRFARNAAGRSVRVGLLLLGAVPLLPAAGPALAAGAVGLGAWAWPDLGPAWRAWRGWPRALPRPARSAGLAAAARSYAARLLQESPPHTQQALLPLGVLAVLVPREWPLVALLLACGAFGEWLSRRPALRPGEFFAGWLLEGLAYSLGRIEGRLHAALTKR